MQCRANDYDKKGLFKKYVGHLQDLCADSRLKKVVLHIAETNPIVNAAKGYMRARLGESYFISFDFFFLIPFLISDSFLTENDITIMEQTVVRVSEAGVPELNGDYIFSQVNCDAGCYVKRGRFGDRDVNYTLYKCSVRTGAFQWFISVPPEGQHVGTDKDVDFYYATISYDKYNNCLPPALWSVSNNLSTKAPAPRIVCISPTLPGDITLPVAPAHDFSKDSHLVGDSDSEAEGSSVVADDDMSENYGHSDFGNVNSYPD